MKKNIFRIVLAGALFLTINLTAQLATNEPWSMFLGNIQHTSLSGKNVVGAQSNISPKWTFYGDYWGPLYPSIVLAADGTIYSGMGTHLHALVPYNGQAKWSYTSPSFGGGLFATPSIGAGGIIYYIDNLRTLQAINPTTGVSIWTRPDMAVGSCVAAGSDGTVYASGNWGNFYAITNGVNKWVYTNSEFGDHSGSVQSSPAIGSDGTIYVGGYSNFFAITNGRLKWKFNTSSEIRKSSPAISPDGTIYFGCYDGTLFALNPNGTEKWRFSTGQWLYTSPAIGPDGTVYITGQGLGQYQNLYAVTNGHQKWVVPVTFWADMSPNCTVCNPPVGASPVVDANNVVYQADFHGKIWAITNGQIKWGYQAFDYAISSTPAIAADGTIYVAGINLSDMIGRVLALSVNGQAGATAQNVFTNIKIRNVADGLTNSIITWTNISVLSQHWIVSDQYVEINYFSNHACVTGWGLQAYTYNKYPTADPRYIGTNFPSGMVDTTFSNSVLPMAWLIKTNRSAPPPPDERTDHTGFVSGDWHYLADREAIGFVTNLNDYFVPWNQGGIGWSDSVRQMKPKKAYMYLAADFSKTFVTKYQTSQFHLDEFRDSNAVYLNRFFLYTNAWSGSEPNHYTPDWEQWSGATAPTMNFAYAGDYVSPGTCCAVTYYPTCMGAVIWYEPGNASSCPSGKQYGYDLTGASKLTFWVKASATYANMICQIGVAGDSCGVVKNVDGSGTETLAVTTTWTKHTIPLTGKNMSFVSRAFKMGVWNPGTTLTVYIDDIRYEK